MTLWLRIRAPFAAYRWQQAGVFRATSPVIPPSAAWGLVLNLAGIEIRDRKARMSAIPNRQDLPRVVLALGSCSRPERASLYQQLHSIPVGNSGAEFKGRCHGNKYWIAPVRREFLVGLDCVIGVRAADDLVARIRAGLAGAFNDQRYGLPFAGDNNFLFDSIDECESPPEAIWYTRVCGDDDGSSPTCRLTVFIDRQNSSQTLTQLFKQTARLALPPEAAWVETPCPV